MKIILSFFSVLILFYGCSKESDSTDEWVDVSFIPSIEYIMTPLNSRSDDIQEPNLLGLIYTSNNIESVVIPENNTFSVKLKMGQYYTIVFIANGISYLNNFEKYSTAHLMLENHFYLTFPHHDNIDPHRKRTCFCTGRNSTCRRNKRNDNNSNKYTSHVLSRSTKQKNNVHNCHRKNIGINRI